MFVLKYVSHSRLQFFLAWSLCEVLLLAQLLGDSRFIGQSQNNSGDWMKSFNSHMNFLAAGCRELKLVSRRWGSLEPRFRVDAECRISLRLGDGEWLEVPCISCTMTGDRLFSLYPVYERVSCVYDIIEYSSLIISARNDFSQLPSQILPSPGLLVALTVCHLL